MDGQTEVAVFGGGCFWCTEAVFSELKGVVSVMPGYAGGDTQNPTYEEVCSGTTGHVEVTRVEFAPEEISYADLLTVFFATHDPTTRNRQGSDVGTQYRSVILYATQVQKQEAERFIADLRTEEQNIVTEVLPLAEFYPAEESHQKYYFKNADQMYCQVVILPKIEKLQKKYAALLKK